MSSVTAVIPTYNREDTIVRCLSSVEAQTYDEISTIVIDDGSSDETVETVKNSFRNVRTIELDENNGAPYARNIGIEVSESEYIAFLDSDDEWEPTKIQKQVNLIESLPDEYGVIYTGIKEQHGESTEPWPLPDKSGDINEDLLFRDHVGPTSSVLVKQKCFNELGGFREDLEARQDYEMWMRISKKFKFDYVNEHLTTLHTGGKNRISDNVNKRIDSHAKLISDIDRYADNMSRLKRRKVMSTQMFTIGRYLVKNGMGTRSILYFMRSLSYYPANLKSIVSILLLAMPIEYRYGEWRLTWRTYD